MLNDECTGYFPLFLDKFVTLQPQTVQLFMRFSSQPILRISFIFPLLILMSMTAYGQEKLMTIGGESIDREELIYLISKGQDQNIATGALSREEFEENLELFINYKLKVKEAEEQELHRTEEFYREYEAFKKELMAPFLIKNSLEEGELKKAYSRMQEVVRASHILFQFPPNASTEDSLIVLRMAVKVKGEIEAGESINTLAEKYSDDPSAKVNKGDLGYFTALQMVQPFEDAAYNMQPGQVSDPVRTNFGYHIISVQDRQPNPGQVRVSHILVRIDADNPEGEDNAKRKIADIYQEIQKESTVWEDIVSNYSEDPASSQKGGLLPWFSVGSMIPEFERAAFALSEEGEVSPPIKTQYGYHILRLEDKKPVASFEAMEKSIRSKILRDSRSSMIQSQVMAIQKSRYSFNENDPVLQEMHATIGNAGKADFERLVQENGLEGKVLFRIQNRAYLTEEWLAFVAEEERIISVTPTPLDAWYLRFVAKQLNKTEENDLLSTNKEYQMLLKEYRDGILLFSLMNKEVWEKGIMDSLGQRQFYNEHLENYQWKDRMEVFLVKVLDINKKSIASSKLNGAKPSKELADDFSATVEKENSLAFQSEYAMMEFEDHPILSGADPSKGYQEIEANGHLHLVLIGEKIPAGPKAFEETRGLIIRDYQEMLEASLNQKLRTKYPVQIDQEAKEETFIALNQL